MTRGGPHLLSCSMMRCSRRDRRRSSIRASTCSTGDDRANEAHGAAGARAYLSPHRVCGLVVFVVRHLAKEALAVSVEFVEIPLIQIRGLLRGCLCTRRRRALFPVETRTTPSPRGLRAGGGRGSHNSGATRAGPMSDRVVKPVALRQGRACEGSARDATRISDATYHEARPRPRPAT